MFKLMKVRKHHVAQFSIMLALIVGCMIFTFLIYPTTEVSSQTTVQLSQTAEPVDEGIYLDVTDDLKVSTDEPPKRFSEYDLTAGDTPFSWVWDAPPPVVSSSNNIYGGAKNWTLNDGKIKMHMCWCYGMRVNSHDPENIYDGDTFDGHTFWSRGDSGDLVFTDHKAYFAIYDHERQVTSTVSLDGSRSHRFPGFSVYFFSNGYMNVTDANKSVDVFKNGKLLIDLETEWDFKYTFAELMLIDQQFVNSILVNNLPWEY